MYASSLLHLLLYPEETKYYFSNVRPTHRSHLHGHSVHITWGHRCSSHLNGHSVHQDVLSLEVKAIRDPMKKKNWCDVADRSRGSWMLRIFLKPSLKTPSICCEFACYNRKLSLNNFFFHNTAPNVNIKMVYQLLK